MFSSEAKICNAQSLSDFYKPLVLLRIAVLREYLSYELRVDIPNAEWSLTRAIDDWILLCFFVGNDFLPHMPSLEIREDAIPLVTTLWKQLVCSSGVYLTCNGEVNTEKVIKLTRMLAKVESHIFRKRRINELNRQSKRQNHSDYGSSAQVPNRWLICDSQTKGARSFPAKDAVMAGHGSNASSLSRVWLHCSYC